jgi:hypothetical protein
MALTASIFFDIKLPTPTTWFYFSGLLAVALFFKFSRLLSMRNLDVLTLFLFTPGLLLLAEAHRYAQDAQVHTEDHVALIAQSQTFSFYGYLWLLLASLYFLVRCFLDLALVRRPALGSNLNAGGLFWLAGALFISLIAVTVRQDDRPKAADEPSPSPTDKVKKIADAALQPVAPAGLDESRLRLWAERGLSLLCQLSVVVGLVLIGWRHFDDVQAGLSAATFYLLLPYTFFLVPDSPVGVGRWDHAWPMAFFVWTVFAYRRPVLAGAFLGVAAGCAYYLVITLPAWLSFYRNRGAGRFLLSFLVSAGLGLTVLGTLLWLNGELPSSLQSGWTRFDWQPWNPPSPDTPSFWQSLAADRAGRPLRAYLVPVFIASMALVGVSAFWPNRKNLAHVLALSAAALIGIQFWYLDRGGVYILWYLPLLLLLVFRPNLAASEPPTPSGQDWLARLARRLGTLVIRLVRPAQRPVAGVSGGQDAPPTPAD